MYNPFGKPVDKLTEQDLLETLPGKSESWSFEYKAADKLCNGRDIARSIASFANAYGGWLFVGIEEGAQGEPQLDPIQGIPEEEGCLSERVYQMCVSNLSPAPYMACKEVNLQNGRRVLTVHVPESPCPPHILVSKGTVPVRSGNTTDPVSVVEDRHELDRLYDRARDNRVRVEADVAYHHRGELFIDLLRNEMKSYFNRDLDDQPVGYYSLAVFPTMRIPSLWEVPMGAGLDFATETLLEMRRADTPPAVREWAQAMPTRSIARWPDHHRCYALCSHKLFYIDRIAHVGLAGVTYEGGSPMFSHQLERNTVEEAVGQILGFAAATEYLYRTRGYIGDVGVTCKLRVPTRLGMPPLELTSSALDLSESIRALEGSIREDLRRLIGLKDG